MLDDLRHSLRDLRRSPGITIALVITLALGVGVNGSMFTVLDRILFRSPDGVRNAREVHRIYSFGKGMLGTPTHESFFSVPDFDAFCEVGKHLAEVAAYHRVAGVTLVGIDPDTAEIGAMEVSFEYFNLLRVSPQRGRFFSEEEVQYGDPHYVAVLSDALWRRRFGADEAILGRTLRLARLSDTISYTIIGIAQPGFAGVDVDIDELWTPFTARRGTGELGPAWWTERGLNPVNLLTRVPSNRDLRGVEARYTAAHRRVHGGRQSFDSTARIVLGPLVEAQGPRASVVGASRSFRLATRLGGISLIILVLAMANAAALMLMRSLWRQRELAVRVALGVSRTRLARAFVIDGIIMTGLASIAATLVAYWSGGLLRPLLFASIKWPHHVLDARLIALIVAATTVATLAASIPPFILAARQDIVSALKAGGHGGNPASGLRSTFLATQTAICVGLLAAAGLFIQSLRKASTVDLGYDPARLLSVTVGLYGNSPPIQAFDGLARRLAADPAVELVSRRNSLGLSGSNVADLTVSLPSGTGERLSIPALEAPPFDGVDASWARVLGLRLRAGRFSARPKSRLAFRWRWSTGRWPRRIGRIDRRSVNVSR